MKNIYFQKMIIYKNIYIFTNYENVMYKIFTNYLQSIYKYLQVEAPGICGLFF